MCYVSRMVIFSTNRWLLDVLTFLIHGFGRDSLWSMKGTCMKIFNFEWHFLEYYLHMQFVYITSDLGYSHLSNSRAALRVNKSKKQFMVSWILQKNERWISALEDYYFKVNTKRESIFFLQEDRLSFVLILM